MSESHLKFAENPTAFITGAGSGIGRATALHLAASGYRLALIDANLQAAEETAQMLSGDMAGQALAMRVDVTSEDAVNSAVSTTVDHFGSLDAAFNGAGIRQQRADIMTLTYEAWRSLMDVNVNGVFLCTRAQLVHMCRQGSGSIVNAASTLGLVGRPNTAAYAASKHAVVGLTKVAAIDAAPHGVRVNAVAPGYTATAMTVSMSEGGFDGLLDAVGPLVPMARLAQPEEIASAIAWLCSGQASYVTGHVLTADGGFTAW
jgi:NAD(P)-dependent dehydrogenase (short-subunit alcohol dehydrogenase family)